MTEPLADRLILVFTFGMSVKAWRDTGMLGRELGIYKALAPYYSKITFVTYGDAQDDTILKGELPAEMQGQFDVVCNGTGMPAIAYADALSAKVVEAVGTDQTVVVKTNQMMGGEAGVRITDALRQAGKQVGLVARGGYLWTRFVTHEHGPHSDAANDAAGREKFLCQAADVVVGTTPDMVEDLAWRYGLNPARTRVIPNYILADRDPTEAAQREKGLILYAGQLIQRKRVDVLVDAMARLPEDQKTQLHLEVIGEGPERRNLMERATRFGASVVFKPRMPHQELVERMNKCMIYAQASELEGHPKTVIEAMGTGAAVVVADSPGLSSVVEHGSTGLRIPADCDAFATAFSEMCGDTEWRDMLGSAAARVTRGRFALEVIAPMEIEAHRLALAVGSEKSKLRVAG